MSFWVLCLLCVVQGLTEFLPVSSSGHLLLIEQLFNVNGNLLLLNLFLHLATLLAVVIIYRKIIWKILKKPFQPLTYKLFVSTVITLIFAFSYKIFDVDAVAKHVYGFCFLITAALLFFTYQFQKHAVCVKAGEISYKNACLVGFVQGLAVLPGISRSGSTISSLILSGNDENQAAEYSFLLSIPIIVGGFVLELLQVESFSGVFETVSPLLCVFAFLLTFAVSMISLKLTIKLLKNKKFIYFSIYVLMLGLFVLGYNFFI